MWDLALFHPPGVEWTGDTPPWSATWIRQLAVNITSDGITSAALLVDDFTQPPIDSDWFDEVRREMQTLRAYRQESQPTRNQ